ncbi:MULTISPECIES: response regulator transcription factor [Catenuloplanes]|uniref:DNA-binding NarL/FixJ family response regulator n=1 Tax=Catenuloplanes niger TaxID=587534 RepID=A0AAE3ZXS6_9ACTN|nr:response regulator transcription factor [Catenuloplanes niger]MDR7328024.1 DNA-binding NarL/FixJ family response regulator [Catenuloplanes niger]
MIRVLLADDETMIRAGVAAILATEPTVEVVAEAGNGREAVDLARRHRPDVALLDIRMPVMDGLEAAAELRRAVPSVAVIMLTTFSEDEYIARALDAGAGGFVLKTGDPRELVTGVRAVADGGAYLSPKVARRVITRFDGSGTGGHLTRGVAARERLAALTDRERDVLRLVGSGLSNAEIAADLHLVEGTVKTHVSAILSRLGLRNRVQAALLAYQAGLTG